MPSMIVGFSFPLDATAESVADVLWRQLGLNVAPADISVRKAQFSSNAMIRVRSEALVDFLNRQFEQVVLDGQREHVRFEKKIHPNDPRSVTVNQITIELPDGKEPRNKNGIRRL